MTVPPITAFLQLDEDRTAQLMQAAQRGLLSEVRYLLYGVSPDVRDQTGRTAFSWAASFDLAQAKTATDRDRPGQLMQLLLDRGADPNLADLHGETALHWAVKAGDEQMVELLLQKGVLSEVADLRGRTPLSRAAERGHDRIVALLLDKGKADPDSKDGRGRTALSWAAENWHLKAASLLVDRGASGDIQDHEGQIPLWWLVSNTARRSMLAHGVISPDVDFQKWLTVLGPGPGIEPMTKARRTFLAWASERGDRELVHHLLRTTWADPNSIDRYRKTPLIYALEWSHYEVADTLMLGVGDDVDRKKDVVSLPVMIQEGRARLLKPFLERYKPSLEGEDEYSSIPLMRMALQQADRPTVAALLEHKARIDELENGDWFGPCSEGKPTVNLMPSRNLPTQGQHSIPVMDMTIPEGDRAGLIALMNHRLNMLDLDEGLNFGAYSRGIKPSVVVDLVALRDGRRKARWLTADVLQKEIKALPKTVDETHLMLFRENYVWETYCPLTETPNEMNFSLGHKSPCRTFTLFIRLDIKIGDLLTDDDAEKGTVRIVEWAMLEAPPKAIHYYSNLPYGWIPQNDLELVQLFMQTWREDWLMICREARRYLGRLRTHQLSARGKDDRLIDSIAKHMQRWTHVQGLLAEQLSQVRDFVTQYQRFSETRKFTEQMQDMISELERDISGQIDKLEQTVRDLLQIEFAWVSINEAHRSTSLATSMKRLSWITFIFLPLTFASSLFGMNVDILEDNPSWRWYPLIGGMLLLLSVASWVFFKFINVEQWLERRVEDMARRTGRSNKDPLLV